MDLGEGAEKRDTTSMPRLIHECQAVAGNSSREPGLPQQPPPIPVGAQSWARAGGAEEEDEEEEETYDFKKVKMFELPPSDDPEMEDRRQRAIYAKKNRDMKKREVVQLQREKAVLHAAQEQCQADLARVYSMAQRQQHKVEELQQCLLDTRQQLKDKEESLHNYQKKMERFQAHLEVIVDSLEEDNMCRRMLLTLLSPRSDHSPSSGRLP